MKIDAVITIEIKEWSSGGIGLEPGSLFEKKDTVMPYNMRVKEVMEICGVSESRAYRIMRQINKELEAKGFLTTAGRVSRKYFMERLYL